MYVTIYDKYIFTFLGFKMSCFKDEVLVEPTIKLVDEYCLISTSDVIKVLNIISIYLASSNMYLCCMVFDQISGK